MILTKKLADIVQDSMILTADFEQRYRDVQTRFVCYRNKQPVHQSPPYPSVRLQTELPHLCRHYGATRVQLIITGSDHQREAVQLYNETFRLARAGHQSATSGGYGLGNAMMPQPMMPVVYQGSYGGPAGLGGLGAVEMAAVMDKRLHDELLRRDHIELQKATEELRRKIAKLEDELAEQVAVNDAHDKFKEYSNLVLSVAPVIAPLLGGSDTIVGRTMLGLGSAQGTASASPQTGEDAGDNEQTRLVMSMVRQFMTGLNETHRQQLLSVMMRIRQDNSLIPHIASFLNKPQQQQAATQHSSDNGKQQQPKDV